MTPVDAPARDAIRDLHEATLFVEAGAGTGKTTALVDRVVSLIARGRVTIRELAAITFTEAAAGELRDRIRYRLEQAGGGGTDSALAPEERERCRDALDDVDDAALSTLHGFAQRILAEHPLEAGLPPRFEVVDDVEAAVRFDERWGQFLDALVADPELEPVLLPALALGVDFDHLRRVARVLHEHYERLRPASAVATPAPAVDLRPVLAPLEQATVRLAECRVRQDKLFQHIDGLAGWIDVLRGADDDLDRLDLLGQMPKLTARKGRHENWRCPVDEVRALLEQAEKARAALVRAQQQATLDVLIGRLRGFVRGYADERRRDGRIEFHDLLVLARDVLQRNPGVRAALGERFRVLLIDEFQDTDPLQIEIAVLLASDDPDAGERPWWEVTIAPGRVFFVGDPKQSIYRFRRADLELYHRVERELHEGRQELTQNFRSVPGVLDWVNHVFARLFDGGQPGAQATHVPLVAERDPFPTSSAPVATFGGPADVPLVADVRAVEANAVAALVRRIKDDRWEIADPVTGQARRARFDDVALLLPTRTALPDLEDALERADVPVRIESQSLVFSTAEIRDLLSILTALDDPTDEIALVASLRSSAFGCGDDELVDYYHRGGRWDYRRTMPDDLPPEHPVVAGMAALRGLHDARWWQSVSQTVEAIVRERRMLELAVTHRRPRDHWRRIRFFLDQARAYDAASGRGLRGFIEWVQQLADERARAVEIVVPEPDDDALRVLTVHGAKGLEFPMVILAGLNVSPPNRATPVLWNPDGSFEVRVGRVAQGTRFETAGWHERSDREDELDAAERLRLLYVASTRARDHLFVSLHHKARTDCHAALLYEHGTDAAAPVLDLDGAGNGGGGEPATVPSAPEPDEGEPSERPGDRDRWIAARTALLARAGRPATVAATTLAKEPALPVEPDGDPGLEKDEPADDRPAWRRGRAGTSVGRAVHAVLQTVDLATGDGLDATARAQALAEGIPQREAEIRALARSVLQSSTVRGAVTGGRYWREVPVAAIVDGVTVEGFVDLLIETLEGLVVVDYKTDQTPTDDEVDAAMERYRAQGAAYALALERALGAPVARCVFVFARRRRPVEREVEDLRAAVAAVERRVTELL
ncbi:MAG TPA: UvrD-helicase domain-containing protein [Acidimicrobiia bacterium]|nr:UvrD-helicase domain-containing protein [Acidimicrobiia bacterium]